MNKGKRDSKPAKGSDSGRPFRLAHQTLCITGFNFESQSLIGYVEMLIHPLKTDLRRIKINSKQCRVYRVAINEAWDAQFLYNDPTLEIVQGDSKQRNLDHFENHYYSAVTAVDADCGNGELTIRMPPEVNPIIQEMKPFRVCIEFSVADPSGGIKFVVPDIDGTMLDRGAHVFTYGRDYSSRLWFPCIDSYNEVCTWKIELTVDMYMTAISCGDLIETVYTTDLRKKTYHYYLAIPTSAPNIALAVGPFEVLVDPNMHEVTHFCLPHLMPILKHSVSFIHEAFEFYEELMSSRYPYSCYKQVFVDQAYCDSTPYATMTILSTNLLHSKQIIDQVPKSRSVMAHAIAQQFFGSFISMQTWYDAWLPKGIAAYLCTLYKRKAFGNNEYRHFISKELKAVEEYERTVGGIILDVSGSKEINTYFSTRSPHTVSERYNEVYEKKAHLVMRMLDIRIGRELLLQAFNKFLSLAVNASTQKFTSYTWHQMLLSTSSFLKGLSTVTGKDVKTFVDQWVQQSGCARFYGSFVFNRKRNVVELELKQDMAAKGAIKYVGPLTVAIQELDGTFNHTFKIEENITKFEITCHSKSRRNKKEKSTDCTGEEIDMDLSAMDADSPVLWLRVDPDMTTLRQVTLEQPDYMWQYMLRYERDAVAQSEAIAHLDNFSTPATRKALTDTIENEHCFYRVRMEAAMCLAKVANVMAANWAGPPAMMQIFRKMFGSHSCPEIVRQNNFTNFQHYHLQKAIPVAMANLRTVHNICPPDVLKFLLDLFKYNDNAKNKYADNYYRAALIDALAATVTPAVNTVTVTGMGPSSDLLTADSKLILEEITRYLNMEKLLASYRLTVTVSCIRAIRKLQKFGHLPPDPAIFKSYAVHGNFLDARLAALEALVDYTRVNSSYELLNWLLDLVEEDPEPYIKHMILTMLIDNPPFTKNDTDHPLSTEGLVERLWRLMNSMFCHDSRLRCDVADLYFTLYGRLRPACLPIPESVMVLNLKEKRTKLSTSMSMESLKGLDDDDEYEYSIIPNNPEIASTHLQEDIFEPEVKASSSPETLKRKADLPLSYPADTIKLQSSVNPGISADPADDPYKLKIKIGSQNQDIEEELQSPPIDVTTVTSPPKTGAASFTDAFLKFAGISPDADFDIKASRPVAAPVMAPQEAPRMVSSVKPEIEAYIKNEFSHNPDSASRLSEDSNSESSLPPKQEPGLPGPSHVLPAVGPTSFDSSMFPQATNSPLASGVSEDSHGKPHKAKKKKKKNKHKHKHKHKHDKGDKEEGVRPFKLDKTALSGLIGEHNLSSDASAANSPSVQLSPEGGSSPEFEVI